jgi:two-component system LytT family sensor kinase
MGALLNLIGLSAGVVLYAMLLLMVVRAGRTPSGPFHVDPLLLATALLGLVWNLCALPAFALARLGVTGPLPLLTFVGTSALGFLPAVVVHSVLRGEGQPRHRAAKQTMLAAAYGVGMAATLLHVHAAVTGRPLPSPIAMRLLTFAFIALLVPVAAVTRGQPGARRALWVAALSAFAVSALHLSQVDPANPSWLIELIGHHASLPLAFAILYQDFPFALADLFLKRALTLLALVAMPFVAIAVVGIRSSAAALPLGDPRVVAVLVILWAATLLLYPRLRDLSDWFVDTVVLDRPDYASLRAQMASVAQSHDEVPAILDEVCAGLAPALSARDVRWREGDTVTPVAHPPDGARAAIVEIPVAEPPRYAIEIAELTGGRRLLSDDHACLAAIAALVGRRIDALRITRERYARELREQEISKLATEAELRALRAQINPHFLFNALTTIGYLIQTSPPRALRTLMRLTTLLRGVLSSDGELTTLERELELIESYLDIERARFEERLRVRVDVPAALRGLTIPPLLLQPLVENAVKHGVGQQRQGGDVVLTARLGDIDAAAPVLTIVVRDTGVGASEAELRRGREAGVGLNNIERRLACHYGSAAALSVRSEPGVGTTVEIRMPAVFKTSLDLASRQTA